MASLTKQNSTTEAFWTRLTLLVDPLDYLTGLCTSNPTLMLKKLVGDAFRNGTAELILSGGLLVSAGAYFFVVVSPSSPYDASPVPLSLKASRYLGLSPSPSASSSSAASLPVPLPFDRSASLSLRALFTCTVARVPSGVGFDGPVALQGVKVGDVVDVLQENVGPGGGYTLCRSAKKDIGWYPTWFLQKEGQPTPKEDDAKRFRPH